MPVSTTCFRGLMGVVLATAAAAAPLLNLPPGMDASLFRVTTFASGFTAPYTPSGPGVSAYPYSMQVLPDHSLLVGVSAPPPGGDFLFARGGLTRLVDANLDGVADGPGTSVYGNLPYAVQSVRLLGNDLLAVSQAGIGGTQIAFLKIGSDPSAPYTNVGAVDIAGDPGIYFNTTMATRPTPGQPGAFDVFFNVLNSPDEASTTAHVTLSGLVSGALGHASMAKMTVQPTAGAPVISNLQTVATGIRNTAGILVQPGTGDVLFTDNGWDIPGTADPLSADELNRLAAAQIGATVADFGFPNSYVDYATGAVVGGGIPPEAAFLPLPAESVGASEMDFAPSLFPTGLNNGLFIGFYGKWETGGSQNTTGPVLYYDLGTRSYYDFIPTGQPGVGHLASLVSTETSLFVADMSASGVIRWGEPTGVIYQIEYVGTPEPGTMALVAAILLLCAAFRNRLRPQNKAFNPN